MFAMLIVCSKISPCSTNVRLSLQTEWPCFLKQFLNLFMSWFFLFYIIPRDKKAPPVLKIAKNSVFTVFLASMLSIFFIPLLSLSKMLRGSQQNLSQNQERI